MGNVIRSPDDRTIKYFTKGHIAPILIPVETRNGEINMKLTEQHYIAMQAAEDGADIYSRPIAELLRFVQKANPEYIEITKPMMYDGDGTDQVPYFGAILTPAGLEALDSFFGGDQ